MNTIVSTNDRSASELARVNVLIEQVPFMVATSFVLSGLAAYFLWGIISQTFIIGWISFILIVSTFRLISVKHLKPKIDGTQLTHTQEDIKRYEVICIAGTLLSGVAYGSLGFMFSVD